MKARDTRAAAPSSAARGAASFSARSRAPSRRLLDAGAVTPLLEGSKPGAQVQRKPASLGYGDVIAAARVGTGGAGQALPHLAQIQRSFGRHDVSGVIAHTDAAAARGAHAMGAAAFTMGNHISFAQRPSVQLAAHEAAHVVQQRSGLQLAGGVGVAGDTHERHADEVAARVAAGRSSEDLLDRYAHPGAARDSAGAVQRACAACKSGAPPCGTCAASRELEEHAHLVAAPHPAGSGLVQKFDALGALDSLVTGAGHVAGDALSTAGNLAKDAVTTGVDVVHDVATGDFAGAGRDLKHGANAAVGHVVSGAEAASTDAATGIAGATNALLGDLGVHAGVSGTGLGITVDDIELFDSFDMPIIDAPEWSTFVPFVGGAVPVGPVVLGGALGFMVRVKPQLMGSLGPGWLRNIAVVVDPLHLTATATGQLYVAGAIGPRVALSGALAALGGIAIPDPPMMVIAGVEGGLRGTGRASALGALQTTVSGGFTRGKFNFHADNRLRFGLHLMGSLDAYVAATLYNKPVCEYLWRLLKWQGGPAWELSIPISMRGISRPDIGPITFGRFPIGAIEHGIQEPPTSGHCIGWDAIKGILCDVGVIPPAHCKPEPADPGIGPAAGLRYPADCNRKKLIRYAKSCGLTLVEGGEHTIVKRADGTTVTEIPHTVKENGTCRSIIKALVKECEGGNAATTTTNAGPMVCSKRLEAPVIGKAANHAFIDDTGRGDCQGENMPGNYAITELVAGNFLKGCAVKTHTSPDPRGRPVNKKPCVPKPGVTDVHACLRDAYSAYTNPSDYSNSPRGGMGPNSNTFAATLAGACCVDGSASGLGWVPGWDHAPAGPCAPKFEKPPEQAPAPP